MVLLFGGVTLPFLVGILLASLLTWLLGKSVTGLSLILVESVADSLNGTRWWCDKVKIWNVSSLYDCFSLGISFFFCGYWKYLDC